MIVGTDGDPGDDSLLDASRWLIWRRRPNWRRAPVSLRVFLKTLPQYFEHTSRVHALSGRDFEHFVAALLWAVGYNVTIQQKTHDGGKDIVATSDRRGERGCVWVECKKPRPEKSVGVAVVRQLLGAISHTDDSVPKGLLVTSGHFTPAARVLAEQNCWKIELRSLDDIKLWMAWYLNREPWRTTRTGIRSPEDDYITIRLGDRSYIRYHKSEDVSDYLRSRGVECV